jgi:phosphatidylglycerophosphatase C
MSIVSWVLSVCGAPGRSRRPSPLKFRIISPNGGRAFGTLSNMTDAAPPAVAVFDLDGTLTWHDTLMSFLAGYVGRNPGKLLHLWRLPGALFSFVFGGFDRGLLKSRVIKIVMEGDPKSEIDAWADAFVQSMQSRGLLRQAGLAILESHRRSGDRLVLMSASPDLYVPRIGRLLGFELTLCTEVAWRAATPEERLDGALLSPNLRGEEKLRCLQWLRTQYPGYTIFAYGNSTSDLAHLHEAERPMLVNGSSLAQRKAARLRIPVGRWL